MKNDSLNNSDIYFDPSIGRKSKLVDGSLKITSSWPLPSIVEISESGTCNRKCSFCPRSNPLFEDKKEFIDKKLLEKLLLDLACYDYSGIFLFSGFVEPMLDKNIYNHLRLVKTFLPKVKIEMVTNGDALNPKRIEKLFNSGLSTLLISSYDGPEESKDFLDMCNSVGLTSDQFVIRDRFLSVEKNFGITLSNRAGMMEDAEFKIPALTQPKKRPCHYPHYTFFMDYNGDVLMCAHDWGKKNILGNLFEESFESIWMGRKAMKAREMLANANRSLSPCNKCDVDGDLMGKNHVLAWFEWGRNSL